VTPEMKDRLDQIVRGHPVVIFMKGNEMFPRCGFSAAAVEALRRAGAEGKLHAVDVLEDPELWESVKEYSDWPTIPQVYVGGEFLGGADITREMLEVGELQPKIESALRRGEEPGEGYVEGER
jgi:monothiol glutaredoxin